MQAQIIGKTVDECVIESLEILKRTETGIVLDAPVSVRLTDPLARFSVMPEIEPAAGVVYGVCALAGKDYDKILDSPFAPKAVTEAFVKTRQGSCLRRFKSERETDQLDNAVKFLKIERQAKIVLHSPTVKPDASDVALFFPFALNLRLDEDNYLHMTAFVDHIDVYDYAAYITPVCALVQEIIALLAGAEPGSFTVIAESLAVSGGLTENEINDLIYDLGTSKDAPPIEKDLYREKDAVDLRYVDNALRYLIEFIGRAQSGDLLVANPFANGRPLKVFYDCAEAVRAAAAKIQGMEVDGDSTFLHPYLARYYAG